MKFLLDENVHHGLVAFLAELEQDVKLSPEGIVNEEVFGLAIKEERILVTRDDDFLNSSLYPPTKHFGIWLLRVPARDLEGQKKSVSKLLQEADQAEEFKGQAVILLPEGFKFVE